MSMVTRRDIEEAVTPLILGVYALTAVTFNGIASFSFNHWDYSLTRRPIVPHSNHVNRD